MMPLAKQWVAVLGGASGYDRAQLRAAYQCGLELARRGRHVITGATTGVPYAAALGAKDGSGLVVGISPGLSAEEHVQRYGKPLHPADLVVYTGMSIDGRAPLILRSASAAVFIGGQMGTLAEFAAGWLCGCPYLGLLESAGGVTATLRGIAQPMQAWGSRLITANEPKDLIEAICRQLDNAARPSWAAGESSSVRDVIETLAEVRR